MIDIEVKHSTLQFTKEEVEEILGQYNRTLNNVQADIDTIKIWIKAQPHCTHIPDDRLILNMLLMHKFSIENCKTKLDYYYSIRGSLPEIFQNAVPSNEEFIRMKNIVYTFTLPKLINLNRVIIFTFPEVSEKFNGYKGLAKGVMNVQALMYQDIYNRLEVVLDYSQTNFTFWSAFTPMMVKIMIPIINKLFSNRLQAVRIIGLPTIAEKLINYAISFLPKKIQDRVSFHGDPKDINKFYPEEQLPLEFGGTNGSYTEMCAEFEKMVGDCEEHFQKIQHFQIVEKFRPMPLDNDENLGFYGNFRKLEID